MNDGLLPAAHNALAEQHEAGFEPDVLTLRTPWGEAGEDRPSLPKPEYGVMLAEPPVRVLAETDLEFYRRKQNVVAVRHPSGDELVAASLALPVVVVVSEFRIDLR